MGKPLSVWGRLRAWWWMRRLSAEGRATYAVLQRLRETSRRLEDHRRQIERRQRLVKALAQSVDEDLSVFQRDLIEAQRLQEQSEEAVEKMRAKLEVLEEVTIPALVGANTAMMKRWDAETAIQARREVAAIPRMNGEVD